MNGSDVKRARYGPWLVGLGAALWGTESAWRIPLNDLFDARVIVFWEHVLILLMFLPLLVPRLSELRKISGRTWGYLSFSGFAGSAVGTIFFTLALKNGNPTVVNVILNIQPVISTLGAFILFRDPLTPRFFVCAGIAIIAGIFLSVEHPELIGVSFEEAGLNRGTTYALICALFWGLSTVAGRGVMTGMSLRLASSLRIVDRVNLHDGDPAGVRTIPGNNTLARSRSSGNRQSNRRALPPRIDLGRDTAPDLFRRTPSDPRLNRRLLRNDANTGCGLHHVGIFSRSASSAPSCCGPDSDGGCCDVTEKP